ncbi:hypothetical protein ACFLWV_02820 [Chloroflexota bacterium]
MAKARIWKVIAFSYYCDYYHPANFCEHGQRLPYRLAPSLSF